MHICIYVGPHRYYVKLFEKEPRTLRNLMPLNIYKSYMFRQPERFQITKVNVSHKSCLPSKLLCNNTDNSMQFLNLYYIFSREMLTATLMSFLPKRGLQNRKAFQYSLKICISRGSQ